MEQKFLIPIFIVVILALFMIKEKIEKSEFSDVNQEKNDELKDVIRAELKQIHSDLQNLQKSLRSDETSYKENFDDGRNISTDLEKIWNLTELGIVKYSELTFYPKRI